MASPFIVPKLVSKDPKGFETCSTCSPRVFRSTKCEDNCPDWCTVCEKFVGSQYKGRQISPNKKVSKQFSNESVRASNNFFTVQYEYEKVKPDKPKESLDKFQPKIKDNFDRLKNIQSEIISKNRPINTIRGKGWCSPYASGASERYLKEVEALRKTLRDLSASRRLPMIPTSSSAKTTKSANGIRSKMPPQNSVNYDCAKEGNQKIVNSDSKRIRHLSDSDSCAVVNILAAPKRLRDHSPLILGKGDNEGASDFMGTTYLNGDSNHGKFGKRNNRVDGVGDFEQNQDRFSSLANLNSNLSSEESHDSGIYSDGSRRSNQPVASSSPSYIVGDSLEKISLDDIPVEDVHPASRTRISSHKEEKCSLHPSLRPSLFPHVPPYIKFFPHDQKADKLLPKSIQKVLKWKLSTITPIVVRQTVANSGFKLVRRSIDWGGIWGRHMKSICFKTLRENQKINHIPGTFQIGRKDRLWKNLYRYMTKFGKKEFGFIPRTYVLPQDSKLLKAAFDRAGAKTKWIVKPPASARGTGIKVIHKWNQIPKKIPLIVQRYISNPYLINGNKFDLRLYVLVTSFNPLRVYLYDNGLVRFASVKYSEENATLTNRYMHLTNYSINKLSNNYAQNEDAEACEGHKWTIRSLWTYLEESVDIPALWQSLIELVIKTMISGESVITQMTKAHLNSRYSAYELFGVDVLLDETLKPWLLEVNISPSLHSASPLDIAVKAPLVTDLLNIVGFHIPNMLGADQAAQVGKKLGINSHLLFDNRMYVVGLSPKEKIKHATFCKLEDREFYLESIIDDLTPDDIRHLIIYEDEMTQLGNFQKIFPTTETHAYFQYLEGSRYYNMLFDAWETKFHNRRSEGIKILEAKCRLQIHLDISLVEPRHTMICTPDTPNLYEDSPSSSDSQNSDSGNSKVKKNGSQCKQSFVVFDVNKIHTDHHF
ncbi:tubulin polyglutamylase ttll-4-like isoform X2 [Rhodnius prolixus]|uniref:tubulin polyglutamylase ttll-4-like isoform X2 n=1 Tax=Rhodnius prolixus TaxID=13249 RepID=UPI003D18853F